MKVNFFIDAGQPEHVDFYVKKVTPEIVCVSIFKELVVFVIIYLVCWGYSMVRIKRSIDAINRKVKTKK